MCQNLTIDEAEYVIDSDASKNGLKIQLYQVTREISNPSILNNLDSNNCFILIANKYHAEDIAKTIDKMYPSWSNRYANVESVFYKYYSLRAMIYNDRKAMERVCKSNILQFLPEYISNMELLIEKRLGLRAHDYLVWMVPNSSRVVFFIGATNGSKYIGKLPSWDKYNTSFEDRERIIEIKKQLKVDKLTIYEDKNGYSLSVVADEVHDWNDKRIIEGVRLAINSIHESTVCDKEMADDAKYLQFGQISNLIPDFNIDLFKNIKENCKVRMIGLCHNDLHCGNVLLYKNDVVLTDFEHVAMGDIVYDTCKFIMDLLYFRSCNLFGSVEEAGEFFFGACSTELIIHIYACVIVNLVKEILLHKDLEDVSWQIKKMKELISKYSEYVQKEFS